MAEIEQPYSLVVQVFKSIIQAPMWVVVKTGVSLLGSPAIECRIESRARKGSPKGTMSLTVTRNI